MIQEIGICLIGAGRAGLIHANNFRNKVPGAHMEAVVDTVADVAENAAKELGITKYFTDYKEVLDDDAVHAVVVVSPTNLHRQIVMDCARAGKHIFCEKPMAMDIQECEEMIEACEKAGVKLQIGFMRRHDESFKEAKRQIDAGEIGEVVFIRSCTRGPSQPREWMYDIKKSNGILAELNSHDIDSVRWLVGSDIKTMNVVAGNYRSREVANDFPYYYDNVVLSGKFENGIQYAIDGAAYVKYGYDAQVEVLGTKGIIHIGKQAGNNVQTVTQEGGIRTPFVKSWMNLFKDAYLTEDIHFAKCVRENKAPCVTGRDGLMAVKVVQEANALIVEQINKEME